MITMGCVNSHLVYPILASKTSILIGANQKQLSQTTPTRSSYHKKNLNWPIPASFLFIFVLFLLQFQYKLKKRRWCAWDSNPGPQDGRHRRNHGGMAATQHKHNFTVAKPLFSKIENSD